MSLWGRGVLTAPNARVVRGFSSCRLDLEFDGGNRNVGGLEIAVAGHQAG